MNPTDCIVGIDLGTTNSEIAVFYQDKVQIISNGNQNMLPSCVGISPTGGLLIGEPARNQQLLYPERTIRSIKRKMGNNEKVTIGEKSLTPQEISSLLLRELARWAQVKLGFPVKKAVISVPAYFSDAQRNATREAGDLAGLDVVRILNEPTAASLAYGYGTLKKQTVMIYDLGGGTFDVSIVTIENDITEVLASHGNNQLGGDDFDQLIAGHLIREFQKQYDIDLAKDYPVARARLFRAAETAKIQLSHEPFVKIREENLVVIDGKPFHLQTELSREDFEQMITPLVEGTLASVSKAMTDARVTTGDLDAILLVGGSTRIPLVSHVLKIKTGLSPRHEVHPDLCVALGAGVLASRLSGHDIERVLVDVSPYSFGPSYLGERDGLDYPYCYHPIIHANTPLPVTKTEKYYTSFPFQTEVMINIFQGENPDALKNIPIGQFTIKGLQPKEAPNLVLCKMQLDIDGILQVAAIEKDTGKSKQITINNALSPKTDAEIREMKTQLDTLFMKRNDSFMDQELADEEIEPGNDIEIISDEVVIPFPKKGELGKESRHSEWDQQVQDARKLVQRSRSLLEQMHDDDKEEAIDLHDQVEAAISDSDLSRLKEASDELRELLFFVEGR